MSCFRAPPFALLALAACAPAVAQPPAPPGGVDAAAREVTRIADAWLAYTDSTTRAVREGRAWTDPSPAARAALDQRADGWIARLRAIDGDALFGRPEWLTYGMLREGLESARQLGVCRQELWAGVDQLNGWHIGVANAASGPAVATADGRARLLERFAKLPAKVDAELANLRAGLAAGYTAPRENVRRVIEQLDAIVPDDMAQSPLHTTLQAPLRADSTRAFRDAWRRVVETEAYPALRRYRDFLRDEYVTRARTDPGLGALPDGAACYRAFVRAYTSLDVAPEELARVGREERARADAALRPLLDSLLPGHPLADAKREVRQLPQYRYASREQMLTEARDRVARALAAVRPAFSREPTAPLVVEPTPAFRERSDPGARYGQPSAPGAAGTFYLNTYRPETRSPLDVANATFHEAAPGHHFQLTYPRRLGAAAHPVTQRFGTGAFTEGWGFYAERLGAELGLYSTPLERAGYVMHQIDGWTGLVVDPSLHVGGWTRETAIDSTAYATGKSREVAASYADRHAATPAQLVSYMTGYRWIVGLREEARAALGARFDLRAFHDVVLEDGSITLPMLRTKVQRWIAAELSRPAAAR
jgi:uncharacterized protein (DUF885 family)